MTTSTETIKLNGKKVIIEDYQGTDKEYSKLVIPKGYRLLKISEVQKLINSKKFIPDKSKWRQFYFQPLFKGGYKLSALDTDLLDDRLYVGGDNFGDLTGLRAFGVFIEK